MKSNQSLFKNKLHIDLERLSKFNMPVQVFAVWLERNFIKDAFINTNKAIDFFESQVSENKELINIVLSYNDIINNKNKISAFLSIEGGEAIEGNIDNLKYFYNRGVRIVTLTWNFENEIGFGAMTKSEKGLKEFGREVIYYMNKLNMIIDVSHLNEVGFYDVCNLSQKPFIASHSNAFKICPNKRNLKDNQIKLIAEKNGMIGINLYPFFISKDGQCNSDEVIKHIDYITKIIGFSNIGLGCDFDGIDITPVDMDDISKINILRNKIVKKYGYDNTEKIFYGNFINFIKQNL